MRIIILTFLAFSLSFTACKSTQSTSKSKSSLSNKCKALERIKTNAFSNLYTEPYTLDELRQEGQDLIFEVITRTVISDASLYWTGAVRKSYPPQASVKLILIGTEESEKLGQETKQTFCFDMSEMSKNGERIKIYIMDDEQAIDFTF